jgi:hypothetical protein
MNLETTKPRMSARTASWLAWVAWVLSLTLSTLSLILLILNRSYPDVPVYSGWLAETLTAMGYSTIGAIIVSRRPNNSIGWLSCTTGLLVAVDHFCAEYSLYTLLASPGSLPAGKAVFWAALWVLVPALALYAFLFLLFPDGRFPGSGWRWFAWLCVLLALMGTVLSAFSPGSPTAAIPIHNPLGLDILPSLRTVGVLVQTLLFTIVLIAAGSMFVRLRRASEVQRQQIKGVAYTAVATASGALLTYSGAQVMSVEWLEWIGYILTLGGLLGVPISMGIAILRYHLYDIDLIINRTLVYGLVTVTLAFLYFGSVTALQSLFSLLTGQGNTLAIVVSTLAIAALFNPLRRRIQSFIDRRFYRRKYDAAKTLEAFGSRLRDETDLERIAEDLGEVVDETMQPSHISLWLSSFPSSSPNRSERRISEARSSNKQSESPPQ